jgi:organic hydroperoxide reductase OsmC/OhrA
MSEHRATIRWNRQTPDFDYKSYNREHTWTFPKSGHEMTATAAPAYKGKAEFVDPEEAFVASIASCHMLTFLAVAARNRFTLDSYDDDATGVLEKDADGRMAITHVTLRPRIVFGGANQPDADTLARMHHESHEQCFIANSVKTQVDVATHSGVPQQV